MKTPDLCPNSTQPMKQPNTLMTVNPKTRPPPICSGKKNPWPPAPRSEISIQVCPAKNIVEG